MLIRLLPDQEKNLLIDIAELLAFSDNPVLWDGKTYDELTADTDLSNISIQANEKENELIEELKQSAGITGIWDRSIFSRNADIESRLVKNIKALSIHKTQESIARASAAKIVLAELLESQDEFRPETPKIMLFEMFLVALRDGVVSAIEQELLHEFKKLCKLPDFIFDEIKERAEVLNSEISKTISLVLE
ncbi:hypothetical protein [Marinobacter sp.]|uniref:hypothetical protein n=1 Tax=Marinobacter sp. TaxID=50741 RepID=UPI003A8DF68F